ncbi:Glycine cleavage system H protein [Ophiocordyceps camponoti-floridani]|uniref:Glycine cleavage system H protein n=1 Tax=Ophiocordyceps camponoti-floridani TaxID=2030778 RepID=A0A8H4VHK3_9HYPO|nr:Glycine cleavage system H protein [Ophiocordyceps camponoti-floridani]
MASLARRLRFATRSPAVSVAAHARRTGPVAVHLPTRSFSATSVALLRRYTREHEWIDLSADRKSGVIGITEYAAQKLGDVVYVEMPEPGDWIEQGDGCGAVESVKSASDINAPIRCKVVQCNRLLEEKPSTINAVPEDDSHGGGWIVKVEVDETGAKQADGLMDNDKYKEFIAEDADDSS